MADAGVSPGGIETLDGSRCADAASTQPAGPRAAAAGAPRTLAPGADDASWPGRTPIRAELEALLDEFDGAKAGSRSSGLPNSMIARARGRYGARRVLDDLRSKGVADEVLERAAAALKGRSSRGTRRLAQALRPATDRPAGEVPGRPASCTAADSAAEIIRQVIGGDLGRRVGRRRCCPAHAASVARESNAADRGGAGTKFTGLAGFSGLTGFSGAHCAHRTIPGFP